MHGFTLDSDIEDSPVAVRDVSCKADAGQLNSRSPTVSRCPQDRVNAQLQKSRLGMPGHGCEAAAGDAQTLDAAPAPFTLLPPEEMPARAGAAAAVAAGLTSMPADPGTEPMPAAQLAPAPAPQKPVAQPLKPKPLAQAKLSFAVGAKRQKADIAPKSPTPPTHAPDPTPAAPNTQAGPTDQPEAAAGTAQAAVPLPAAKGRGRGKKKAASEAMATLAQDGGTNQAQAQPEAAAGEQPGAGQAGGSSAEHLDARRSTEPEQQTARGRDEAAPGVLPAAASRATTPTPTPAAAEPVLQEAAPKRRRGRPPKSAVQPPAPIRQAAVEDGGAGGVCAITDGQGSAAVFDVQPACGSGVVVVDLCSPSRAADEPDSRGGSRGSLLEAKENRPLTTAGSALQVGAAEEKPKVQKCAMFMSVQERKKLKQEETRKAEEARRAAEEARRAAEELDAAAQDAAAAAAVTATQAAVELRVASAAGEAHAAVPINPFFMQRKRVATAGPGVALDEGSRPNVSAKNLKEALAPIHITQTQPAAIHDSLLGGAAAPPRSSSSSSSKVAAAPSHLSAPAIPLASLLQPVKTECGSTSGRDSSEPCGFYWLQQRGGAAAGIGPGPTAGTSIATAATTPHGSLLEQLAQQLAHESGVAMADDAHLMDRPSYHDILSQLQQELEGIKAVAASAQGHTAAVLGGSTAHASSGAPGTSAAGADPTRGRGHLPWPLKYAPFASSQVCGGHSGVAELKVWLSRWHDIIAQEAEAGAGPGADTERGVARAPGRKRSWAVSDDDSWIDESSLNSWADSQASGGVSSGPVRDTAIIVSGPHGCGKTAAVFACAQELGFNVIEINPGMDRGGAQVLRLVGEATQSRRLMHKADLQAQSKPASKGQKGGAVQEKGSKKKASGSGKGSKRKVLDESPSPPQTKRARGKGAKKLFGGGGSAKQSKAAEESDDCVIVETNAAPAAPARGAMTVVLFEEAELLLEEDKGFVAALGALIMDSKRPMVLCINSLGEPPGLEKLELLHFKLQPPPHMALLRLCCLVAEAEGAGGHTQLAEVEGIVAGSGHDVRKALMTLQFWLTRTVRTAAAAAGPVVGRCGAGPGVAQTQEEVQVCLLQAEAVLAQVASSTTEGLWAAVVAAVAAPPMPPAAGTSNVIEGQAGASFELPQVQAWAAARQQQLEDHHVRCEAMRCAHISAQWRAAAAAAALDFFKPRNTGRGKRGRAQSAAASCMKAGDAAQPGAGASSLLEAEPSALTAATPTAATHDALTADDTEMYGDAAGGAAPLALMPDEEVEVTMAGMEEGGMQQQPGPSITPTTFTGALSHLTAVAGTAASGPGVGALAFEPASPGPGSLAEPGQAGHDAAGSVQGMEGVDGAALPSLVGTPEPDMLPRSTIAAAIVVPELELPEAPPPPPLPPRAEGVLATSRSSSSARQACAALQMLSCLHDRLSAADVLGLPLDLVPPVSGPCPRAHQALPTLSRPLAPGANALLACSQPWRLFPRPAMPVSEASGRGAAAGDALDPVDGGAHAAAAVELVAEECVGLGGSEPRADPTCELQLPQEVGALLGASVATVLTAAAHRAGMQLVADGALPTGLVARAVELRRGGMLRAANDALYYSCDSSMVQSHPSAAIDRLAALARICKLEAVRAEEATRGMFGRVRRTSRSFTHVLSMSCPEMPDTLMPYLQDLGDFGQLWGRPPAAAVGSGGTTHA